MMMMISATVIENKDAAAAASTYWRMKVKTEFDRQWAGECNISIITLDHIKAAQWNNIQWDVAIFFALNVSAQHNTRHNAERERERERERESKKMETLGSKQLSNNDTHTSKHKI
jgi:uncharacterized protein YdaU (DUF1376 family)